MLRGRADGAVAQLVAAGAWQPHRRMIEGGDEIDQLGDLLVGGRVKLLGMSAHRMLSDSGQWWWAWAAGP